MATKRTRAKLLIDEEAAGVVRKIYQYCLEGHGKQRIAALLNEQGVKNPTRYKQSKGHNYINGQEVNTHGLWNKTSVGRILSNEMCGCIE